MKYRVTRKMPEFRKPKDPELLLWHRKMTWISGKLDITDLRRIYCIACSLYTH